MTIGIKPEYYNRIRLESMQTVLTGDEGETLEEMDFLKSPQEPPQRP